MTEKPTDFDISVIEKMNQKAIQSQFFVPDNVYIELGLFKDLNLGAIYADLLFVKDDEAQFTKVQKLVLENIEDYQVRRFDTMGDFLNKTGYNDTVVDKLLCNESLHDQIFVVSPATKFIQLLVRHLLRNQNNSRPADKYIREKIDDQHYTIKPQEVTFRINTFPLTLSNGLLEKVAEEFGEAFGVNIVFMNKDPSKFDHLDWNDWMKKTDCYYLDSLGRFTKSPIVKQKQGNMEFVGIYLFARKRFEREVLAFIKQIDFDQQVQMVTSHQGILCDFEWIQNNDLRLTEDPINVPMMDDDQEDPESDTTETSGIET